MAQGKPQTAWSWRYRGGRNLRRVTGIVLSLSCLVLVGLCFPQAVGAQAQLGNPQPGSAQSGIGVISGWACEAQQIEIEFNNESANRWRAGTGTTRPDTQAVCGDTDNGFGLLYNWNRLGDGTHTVRAFADGVEFAHVVVIVTTLEDEFRQDASGDFPVTDFPTPGTSLTLRWQQALQNFVLTDGRPVSGGGTSGRPPRVLGNPQPGSAQSGIGVISGWACEAQQIEIEFNNESANRWRAGTGTRRPDTQEVCGDTDNGFGLLYNWNRLGDGTHTVRAFADGVEFANVTVHVTTLGKEFRRDLNREVTLPDFPEVGTDVVLEWQQAQQNFVIASAGTTQRLVAVTPTLKLPPGVSIPNVTISSLYTDGAEVPASPEPSLLLAVDADGTVLLALADQDGGLLGEAPGVVEVSVESTAVTLVGLLAGIAVHDMTPSVVADIQAHAQYQPVVATMNTELAADKNFLDRLYAFPAIVDRLRQIADSLPGAATLARRTVKDAARRVATRDQPPRLPVLLQSLLDAVACLAPTAYAQEGGSSDTCAHRRAKTLEIIGLTTVDMIYPVKDTIALAEALRDMPSVGQPFLICAVDRTATWVAEHPGQTPPLLPEWNVRPDENIAVGFIVDNFEALKWQYDVLWPCIAATPSQYRNAANKAFTLAKNVTLGRVLKGAKATGQLKSWLHTLYGRASKGKKALDASEELDELESKGCTGPVNAAGQPVEPGETDSTCDQCLKMMGHIWVECWSAEALAEDTGPSMIHCVRLNQENQCPEEAPWGIHRLVCGN